MRRRIGDFTRCAALLGVAVGLFACGGPPTPPTPADTASVTLRIDTGGPTTQAEPVVGFRDLRPLGVPVDSGGAPAVTEAVLRVFSGGAELFFDAAGNVVASGGVTLTLTSTASLTLLLPHGTYTFEVEARDDQGSPGNLLAAGSLADVEISAATALTVHLSSRIGSADLLPPATVVPNEVVDVRLVVHPPGRPDLLVPTGDFTFAYSSNVDMLAETALGVRLVVECEVIEVTVRVYDSGGALAATKEVVLAAGEVCASYQGGVEVDLIPPFLTVSPLPNTLYAGVPVELTGTVNDAQTGVVRVTLYEGPVLVSEATIDREVTPNEWSVEWIPDAVRAYGLAVIAEDGAGNESRWLGGGEVVEVEGFISVAAGGQHSCGLVAGGSAYCWGDGLYGQLGNGLTSNQLTPVLVSGGHEFVGLVAGDTHSCGLVVGGSAYCWGSGTSGQLGNGSTADQLMPVLVSGGHEFISLSAGYFHSCGVVVGGSAYCWGVGASGRLGNGSAANQYTPVLVSGGHEFVSLAAGLEHSCGVVVDGSAYCWGSGAYGQLGNGSGTSWWTPAEVSGGYEFTSITAGYIHSCGVVVGGSAYCWGRGVEGQLGDGLITNRTTPLAVYGDHEFNSLSAGYFHTCGVVVGGSAYCWGYGTTGQLGNGFSASQPVPVLVSGSNKFISLTAGYYHSCGVVVDGSAYCWGRGAEGQLGIGSTAPSTFPVLVAAPVP